MRCLLPLTVGLSQGGSVGYVVTERRNDDPKEVPESGRLSSMLLHSYLHNEFLQPLNLHSFSALVLLFLFWRLLHVSSGLLKHLGPTPTLDLQAPGRRSRNRLNAGWAVRLCPVWKIDSARAGGSQRLRPIANVKAEDPDARIRHVRIFRNSG